MNSPSQDSSNDFDPVYSKFRSAPIQKVPILRVFGITPAGQKACLHIHGIFPYLYVPMPPGDNPGFLYRLAASLDKALNMTKTGTGFEPQRQSAFVYDNPNHHHVYKIVEVTGRPYYGYHAREHRFAKIYFYNPYDLRKASDLLASGSVMGQILQPHYGHIPYTLQFMMDYNLQGMSLIHVKIAQFRHPNLKVTYESQDVSFWSDASKEPSERLFKIEKMPQNMLTPDSLPPMTTCEIELDAIAADILNSNEDLSSTLGGSQNFAKKSGNPGLNLIWEDERLRRLAYGIDLEENPLTPPSSPPRQRSPSTLTDSEQFWNDRFDEALDTWRENGILDDNEKPSDDVDATVNFDPTAKINVYPDETANESILQTASFVEEHLKSLSLENPRPNHEANEDHMFLDKTDFFDDTLVDEDIISQHLESDLDLLAATLAADKTVTNLDEDDKELVELLRELKSDQQEENSQKADSNNSSQTSRNSQKIPSQTKSIGSKNSQKSDSSADSLILSQHLSQMSKEKYESEVNETLEMTKILDWDDDNFFDVENQIEQEKKPTQDFDDDSFWENYDFESVLD